MSASRDEILSRLRKAKPEITSVEPVQSHIPVVPLQDTSPQVLTERFVTEAELLASRVHQPGSEAEALKIVLDLLGEDQKVMSWAFDTIPLPGLETALTEKGIHQVGARDGAVRVGITGADGALAATGSLVLSSGPDRPRLTSLLPPVHIAIIREEQIIPDLETWGAELRSRGPDAFREIASAVIISGPSRTADIAQTMILGMHGPWELHIIILT